MAKEIYSKEELDEQEKGINKVGYIIIPILILTLILGYFYTPSDTYKKGLYLEKHLIHYNGIVANKKYDGGRFPRYLILENGFEIIVNEKLYEVIKIGDSVNKKTKSDSVYYFSKNNGILIFDLNKEYRGMYNIINAKK
jgi:hypothetical protein